MSDAPPAKRPRGLSLLSIAAVLGALLAPLTYGASSVFAAVLLAIAAVLARRGYRVRRYVVVAIASLVLTAVALTTWQRFFLADAEVSGGEVIRHERTEERFDTAFGKAQAPPPGQITDASGVDAGADFVNDAGR